MEEKSCEDYKWASIFASQTAHRGACVIDAEIFTRFLSQYQ